MNRRKDYKEFKQILERYNITRFYHFTDRDNIASIIKNGGLYSFGDCIKRRIRINKPGGSELSHELDYKENLQNYVRVSICKKHPMMFTAMQEERINNPVILEIDTDVLFIEGNLFSDKNAVRKDSNKGANLADFNKIHFNTVKQKSQFDVEEEEQEYYQAEILVPHHIPLHYILNISDYQTQEDKNVEENNNPPYSSSITEKNPEGVFFILNQSYPTNEIVEYGGTANSKAHIEANIIDKVINELIIRNTSDGIINDRYHIAVVGYGDCAYNCLDNKSVMSLKDLHDNPTSIKTTTKTIRTRTGEKAIEVKQPKWVRINNDGEANLFKAFVKTRGLVEDWVEKHKNSFPPIVIHITEFRYHGADDSDMKQMANEIKSMFTKDGNVLLFNIVITNKEDVNTVSLPSSELEIKKSFYGKMYYSMSSTLPSSYFHRIEIERADEMEQRKGLLFNIKLSALYEAIISIIPK